MYHMSLIDEAKKLSPWLIGLRRDLHRHPELSLQEFRTSEKVCSILSEFGIPYDTGFAKTGVIATLEGNEPGPCIALRADMDALPLQECPGRSYGSENRGIMHACGHDAHTAILLGAARLLRERLKDIKGKIVLLFQPAEESIGGARMMVEEGIFEKFGIQAVFGLHVHGDIPCGYMGINRDRVCASVDNFRGIIKGNKAHGAYPHQGNDAVVAAGQIVVLLQTVVSRQVNPLEGAVLTIGSIHGGTAPNIIADEVVIEGTLRTHSSENRDLLIKRVREIISGTAATMNCNADVEIIRGTPALTNDLELALMVRAVSAEVLGEEKALLLETPTMGGEDFAYYLEKVKGAFYRLGSGNEEKGITSPGHSSEFDIDEDCLPIGVALQTAVALRWLEDKG